MKVAIQGKIVTFLKTAIVFGLLLSFVKAVFVSFDIDESYAVTQAYRIVQGDQLFRTMWEPHQLSAYFSAFFIWIYSFFTKGDLDYLVIFLRITGCVIHGGIGLLAYFLLQKTLPKNLCFVFASLHMLYLPKWIQLPEFELMQYWFLLLGFLCLYEYTYGKKHRQIFLVITGLTTFLAMTSYVTMILLYPVYLLAILKTDQKLFGNHSKRKIADICIYTVGALIPGLIFLGYLFSYMTFDELMNNFLYILKDESHTSYTLVQKLSDYGISFLEMLPVFLVALLIAFVDIFILRRSGTAQKEIQNKHIFITNTLTAAMIVLQLEFIWGCLFMDENQFFLQSRFFAMALGGLYFIIKNWEKNESFFYQGWLPGIVSVIAIGLLTNMGIEISMAHMFLPVLLIIVAQYSYYEEKMDTIGIYLSYTLIGLWFFGLLLSRLILIRVSGCFPTTILADMERIEDGPGKGIYVLSEYSQIFNENYQVIKKQVSDSDKVLYIGAETLYYMYTKAEIAGASVQGTASFNQMFIDYFTVNPDKMPDVIIIDLHFFDDPSYSYSVSNQILFQWIETEFEYTEEIETLNLRILQKN